MQLQCLSFSELILQTLCVGWSYLDISKNADFYQNSFFFPRPKHHLSGHVLLLLCLVFSSFLFLLLQQKNDNNKTCHVRFENLISDIPTSWQKHYFGTPTHYLWFYTPQNTINWGTKQNKSWTSFRVLNWTSFDIKPQILDQLLTLQHIYIYAHICMPMTPTSGQIYLFLVSTYEEAEGEKKTKAEKGRHFFLVETWKKPFGGGFSWPIFTFKLGIIGFLGQNFARQLRSKPYVYVRKSFRYIVANLGLSTRSTLKHGI